jgi:DNA-binding NarL/FixJ family response regulator
MMAVRVLLADDHLMVREAIKVLLEAAGFEVVGVAGDGGEALRLARRLQPDVAVLDLMMPVLNGVGAARGIQENSPSTRSILLTSSEDEQVILEALRAGVRGCVLKTAPTTDLVRAIHDVMAGGVYLSSPVARSLLAAYQGGSTSPADPLSSRERQVLQLIADGKRTREVAEVLGVSLKTAESHRGNIMRKLGIADTAGLVRYALQRGLSHL